MFFTEVNMRGLCLLIFVVILICFSSSPADFSFEAALSFGSTTLWIPVICCVASLPSDLRSLLFYVCWHRFYMHPWVASVGLHQRSLLPLQTSWRGFSALTPSIIIGPFGRQCLWWLSPASFVAVMTVFCRCSLPWIHPGSCFCDVWRCSRVSCL
jgi:hypothetical protein